MIGLFHFAPNLPFEMKLNADRLDRWPGTSPDVEAFATILIVCQDVKCGCTGR